MTKPIIQYRIDKDFDAAEASLREALQEEGFGILTEVDFASVLHQKLGVETRPHKLLGACNPRIAHASVQAQPDVAAFLPCGIALREGVDPQETIVTIQNPAMISEAFQAEGLAEPAGEALRRLEAALARIGVWHPDHESYQFG